MWLCKCDCGNEARVSGSNLIRGKPHHTTSCGCESAAIDETGNRYGYLTVLGYASGGKKTSALWKCHCEKCGNDAIVRGASLRSGDKISCGCVFPDDIAAFRSYISSVKTRSRKLKITGERFNLSNEEIADMCSKDCFYCGLGPSNSIRGFIYNGIDRIDSSKGYINGNVVPCCAHCNRAKNSYTVDEFKNWVCRVYENWAGK
jgi:hypothetical protein